MADLTVTRSTSLFTDVDGDGKIDPGDTILTTIEIKNITAGTLTGLHLFDDLNGSTLVSLKVTPIANDDSLGTITGNTPITFNKSALLGNDVDPDGNSATLTLQNFASPAHGTLVDNGDGTLTYTPATGYTGADSFTYNITDAQGLHSVLTGTVSLNVSGLIWYVDSAAAPGGDGSYGHAFQSFTAGNLNGAGGGGDVDGAGDTIFVYDRGTSAYTSDIILENNQTLYGDGHALTVNGLTIGATASNTTINHNGVGITLAQGNTIDGIDLVGGTLGAVGVSDNGGTVGIASITNMAISGKGAIIDVDNGGTLNASLTSASSTGYTTAGTGGAIDLQGLTGTFAVTGATTINQTDGAQASGGIHISGASQTANFTGGTTVNTGTTTAVSMGSGTLNFSGGLNVDTTSGTGILTTGGTLGVAAGTNTVDTTTGHIVDMANTSIGAGNATFTSLTATGAVAGNAITLNHVTNNTFSGGTVSISSTTGAGADGIHIDGTGAGTGSAITFGATTIGATGGDGIEVTGRSNSTVDFTGNLTDTSGVAAGSSAISIHDNTGGTTTFSGQSIALTTAGSNAVNLINNTGATIAFNPAGGGNGLDISTTTGIGFNASGGGTVTVQGTGNTINSTGNAALSIVNTNIGAADATFQSISAGSGSSTTANGITLDTTGTAGGLKVTGNGTNVGATGGGVIQNMIGPDGSTTQGNGIYLNNTSEVSINGMSLQNFGNHGIYGLSVNGIRLTYTNIGGSIGTSSGSNDLNKEAPVQFGNTAPSVANGFANGSSSLFDHVNISGGIQHNVELYQDTGTFNLTISNSSIHDNDATLGADGINMELTNTAHGIVKVDHTSFTNNLSQAFQASALANSNLELTVDHNTVSRTSQGNEGFVFQNAGNAHLTTAITNNSFSEIRGTNIFVGQVALNANAASELDAIIQNNTINISTAASNRTIAAFLSSTAGQAAVTKLLIDNNVVNRVTSGSQAIFVEEPDAGATPTVYATVSNNTVNETDPTAIATILIDVAAQQGGIAHFDVRGNDANYLNGAPAGVVGVRARQSGTATVDLQRDSSAGATTDAVIADNNPLSTTNTSGTMTISANGTVLLPSSPSTPTLPSFLSVGAAPPSHQDQPGSNPGDTGTASGGGNTGTSPVTPGDTVTPGETGGAANPATLTQAVLDTLVAEAIHRWELAGATPEQLAVLRSVGVTVSDMSGSYVGTSNPGSIQVDVDAGGFGWFLDGTPGDDSEYSGSGTELAAKADGGAAGKIDLLTVIMHELGHQIGLGDDYRGEDSTDLMYGYVLAGERRLPSGQDVQLASTSPVQQTAFATTALPGINPFDLAAGKTVDVLITSTWNAYDPAGGQVPSVNNDATVTYGGGVGTSESSATETLSPISTLALDTLVLGGTVWADTGTGVGGVAGDGIKQAGELGIDGVSVTLFIDNGTTAGVWDAGDTQLYSSQLTGGGGNYSFTGLGPGSYIVRIDADNFDAGGNVSLVGNPLSSVTTDTTPDDNIDNDDNGVQAAAAGVTYSNAITLAYNSEPTAGPGNDTNNTLDFGFLNNVPPTLGVTGAGATYTETAGVGSPAGTGVTVLSASTITDPDDTAMESATVTISNPVTGDLLAVDPAFTLPAGLSASFAANVLTITGTGTLADYQSVLAHVVFSNAGDDPTLAGSNTSRTISFVVSDGTSSSTAQTATVGVAGLDDAPVNTPGGAATVLEDASGAILSGVSIADPDADPATQNVTVTLSVGHGALTLLTSVPGGIVAGDISGGANGSASVQVTATLDKINATLAGSGLTYSPAADYNGTDQLTIVTSDNGNTGSGGPLTDTDVKTINITPVNDAPVLTPGGTVHTYTENGPDLHLVDSLDVADVDNTNFNGGTYTATSADFLPGDQLDLVTGVTGITIDTSAHTIAYLGNTFGSYTLTANTLSVALNSFATPFAIEALTFTLSFISTSDDPTAADRHVTITLVDGGGTANGGTDTASFSSTVHVVPVNDNPVVANFNGDSATFTEGDAKAALDVGGNATLTDPDSHDFDTAVLTVHVSGGGFPAEDLLFFDTTGASPFSMSGNNLVYGGALTIGTFTTPTVGQDLIFTFNANATPAMVQSLLQYIVYADTSVDDPTAGSRAVHYTLTDGDGGSTAWDSSVQVVAVNDAPSGTVTATQSGLEDTPIVFSTGNANAITVVDPDAHAGLKATLSVLHGTLTLGSTAGLTVTGNGTGTVVVVGTPAAITAGLQGLSYLGAQDYYGSDTLNVHLDDQGNTGTPGPLTSDQNIAITLANVNDVPVVLSQDLIGAVTEMITPVGNITDSGIITFKDADPFDVHSVTSPGTPIGSTLGSLTATIDTDTTGTGLGGQLSWHYSVAAQDVEYLAAGETKVESFTITLDDNQGGTVTKQIDVTIAGTNDAPEINDHAHFDGASYLDITGPALATGTGAYSYNVVFRATANGLTQTLVSTGPFTTNHEVGIVIDPSGHLNYGVNNAVVLDGGAVADGQWHEVTATYDGAGHHILYVDGVQVASVTATGVDITGGPALIGAANTDHRNLLVGDIAEVNIWNRALTATEANAVGTPPANSPGLIGSYQFENAADVGINSVGSLPHGTVTGTVVVTPETAAIGETAATSGSAALHSSTGTILFNDVDLTDTHSVTSAAQGGGYVGTFSATLNAALDRVGWSFSVPDSAIDFLSAGETLVQTYAVNVLDNHGGTGTTTVTVTMTGTNDAPVAQADTALTDENHAVQVNALANDTELDHLDNDIITSATLAGGSTGLVTIAGDGHSFTYDPNGTYAYLSSAQQATVTVNYTIDDGHGGTSSSTATITVQGVNAPPVILGSTDALGLVTELPDNAPGENSATLTDSGAINFSDSDLTDAHTYTIVPQGGGYLGTMSSSLTETVGSGLGSIGWSFSVSDAALNSLGQGVVLKQYYDVTIDDGHGGSTVQTIEVDLVGTNDAAHLSSANVVIEQGPTLVTTSGDLTITDEDNPALFFAQSGLAGSYGHFSIAANGHWTYTADAIYSLAPNQYRTDVFTALAVDGTPTTVAVTIAGHDSPAMARQDFFYTDEATPIGPGLNLFNDNGSGADSDPDSPLSIVAVNGFANAVGQLIGLPSGAVVRVNADGTFSYNPNHAFDSLTGASGAGNTFAFDQFSYTLAGGSTAMVIVNIAGLNSPQDILVGTSGDNVITGTPQPDTIMVQQGGHDTVHAQGSDDGIYFGAALDSGDSVDGGPGNDTVALQGNTNVVLGDIVNVENLLLLSGSNAMFGDLANNRYSYDITTNDGNVAAGQTLTVIGTGLLPGENLHFDGSAETDGNFAIFAGQGVDNLIGGGGSDGFFFGADGNLTGADHVDGGAGIDALALRGNYTGANAVVFTDTSMANIEVLALLSGHTNEYSGMIVPTGFDYDVTMADGNVAAGHSLDVIATGLGADESVRFDGRLESNGSFRVLSGAGDDILYGGAGNDILYGGLGADRLEGGPGADSYVYRSAAESTSSHYDTITGFDWHNDVIDAPGSTPRAFTQAGAGALSTASFDADLADGLLGILGAGQAALFTATSGTLAGHVFAVIDANGVAGYQAGQDLVIDLVAPVTPIPTDALIIA